MWRRGESRSNTKTVVRGCHGMEGVEYLSSPLSGDHSDVVTSKQQWESCQRKIGYTEGREVGMINESLKVNNRP